MDLDHRQPDDVAGHDFSVILSEAKDQREAILVSGGAFRNRFAKNLRPAHDDKKENSATGTR
jgi:hypothetical protein